MADMPEPIAVCIENEEQPDDGTRFIRCVALEGNRAGLAIDPAGRPLWMDTDGCACELWVSADEQLMLLRPQGAPASRVHRAGRSLVVPAGKPVVMLDQDQIEVGGVTLRLHVHGLAEVIHPPTPFVPPRASAAVLAAAMALGVAAGCDRTETTGAADEDTGTTTAAITTGAETSSATSSDTASSAEASTAAPTATQTAASSSTASTTTTKKTVPTKPPIEVRTTPPKPVRRDPPKEPQPIL